MLTVTVSFEESGKKSTCRPLPSSYSVMPSTLRTTLGGATAGPPVAAAPGVPVEEGVGADTDVQARVTARRSSEVRVMRRFLPQAGPRPLAARAERLLPFGAPRRGREHDEERIRADRREDRGA